MGSEAGLLLGSRAPLVFQQPAKIIAVLGNGVNFTCWKVQVYKPKQDTRRKNKKRTSGGCIRIQPRNRLHQETLQPDLTR